MILWFGLVVMLGLIDQNQGQSLFKKPLIYVAGPDQLTLVEDAGGVRFGYQALNQFRAERRHPNGTVEGFYGYIGADGKPVRVKYTASDDVGYQTSSEEIPLEFPEESPAIENIIEGDDSIKLPPINEFTSDEAESISVIAADSDFLPDSEGRVRKARSLEKTHNAKTLDKPHKAKKLREQIKKQIRKDSIVKKLPNFKKWFAKIQKKMAKKH